MVSLFMLFANYVEKHGETKLFERIIVGEKLCDLVQNAWTFSFMNRSIYVDIHCELWEVCAGRWVGTIVGPS